MSIAVSVPPAELATPPLTPATSRQQVARAFDRGAADYLTLAQAQHAMAATLFASLPERLPADARVLDLGCGPGHWTLELAQRYSGACCMGLDLSLEMLREAARQTSELASGSPERLHWLRADAERLPLAAASLDLVFSSLAVQWCDSPRQWLAELSRTLKPGARAHINTLGPGTLKEVRHAWQRADDSVRHFPSATHIARHAEAAGLRCHWQLRPRVFHYPDVAAVMASIKGIGAQTATGRRLTRAEVQQAKARHETLRTAKGLPVSYQVIELVLEKPFRIAYGQH